MQATATAVSKTENTHLFLEDYDSQFKDNFQRACFSFPHRLANHPLFKTDALLAQAQAQPESVYFDAGEVRVDQRWSTTQPQAATAEHTIRNIDNAKAWVLLKNSERNPDYARLIDGCLAEAEELTGCYFRKDMRNRELIIILSSPNRVTPYHIDRECNFLVQITGSKTIYTFDGTDRSIVSEEEIERFWTVDHNAARYKPASQEKAKPFRLDPGRGVHIPINFPHWVQNSNNVSVSASINFQFQDSVRANIYRANFYLRQKGLKPSPPGRSPWKDSLKSSVYGQTQRVLRMIGK
jgi:hypothetical protein